MSKKPTSPPKDQVWYNPETEKTYQYDGEKWVECSEAFLDGRLEGAINDWYEKDSMG